MRQNIKVSFQFMDKEMKKIITTIRLKLEYAAVVWPTHKKDIRVGNDTGNFN